MSEQKLPLQNFFGRQFVKKPYVRLFSNPQTVERTIQLLNEGYTFTSIGREMCCDKSSVIAFYKRQEKEGTMLIRWDVRTKSLPWKRKKIEPVYIELFPVNRGKDTYADYAALTKKRIKEEQAASMARARETINRVRKQRREWGISDTGDVETEDYVI